MNRLMLVRVRRLAAAAIAVLTLGAPLAASASPPRGDFHLGRSTANSAVCEAVRDWDDAVGIGVGRRAWKVTCRGWTQTLGRIYYFEDPRALGDGDIWRKALSTRADCDFASAKPVPGVASATAAVCQGKPAATKYVAYRLTDRHGSASAEGFAAIGDVLATGLQVASGRIAPPSATQQASVNLKDVLGGSFESLTVAAESVGASATSRKEAAYRDTQLWQFGAAEARFGGLANLEGLSRPDRAEAALNLAISVSNESRFAEADAYFRAADALVADANSASLKALALNYRSLHARNQRKFAEAIDLANQAIGLRNATAEPFMTKVGLDTAGEPVIGRGVSDALNSATQLRGGGQLTSDERESLRDVQALQVIGTSQMALRQTGPARGSLQRAHDILTRPRGAETLAAAAPWLYARIEADMAAVDRSVGANAEAAVRLGAATDFYDARYPDSLASAGLLMELARTKQALGDENGAITDYDRALRIFQSKRGSLGASADFVSAYFDILQGRIDADPQGNPTEAAHFFASAETLVSESAAAATVQLAERLSTSDAASADLSRTRSATLRLIEQTTVEIRQAQQVGAYSGPTRADLDGRLADLQKQDAELEAKILEANPRYAAALGETVKLADLQSKLGVDEAYLKIMMFPKHGFGILITKDQVRPYRIDLDRAQVADMAKRLRQPFDRVRETQRVGVFDVALARDIYKAIIGPIEHRLGGVKRLIYEPDPSLIGVPLGALVIDDASVATLQTNLAAARRGRTVLSYQGVNWLETRLETSVSISARAFIKSRAMTPSQGSKAFAGFANPVITQGSNAFASVRAPTILLGANGGSDFCAGLRAQLFALPALPETSDEVRQVAAAIGAPDSLVEGAGFTDDQIKADGAQGRLKDYRVLYFATHGLLPQANGCLPSSIVTSQGGPGSDSLLDTNEIPDLTLDADLVVLSACDTGAGATGGVNAGGSAVGGLVSAFNSAGARNVLVSNWEVDTTATETFMSTMFKSGASSQGEALAQARRAIMTSSPTYSHPYYWAAFSVFGDSARAMPKL